MKALTQIRDVFDKDILMTLLACILVIVTSVAIYKILIAIINKGESMRDAKLGAGKKSKTYIRLAKNLIRLLFITVTSLIILQLFGMNVSSVLAGLGIFGIVAGLALQDFIKDMVRGSIILSDSYFSVGDTVRYAGAGEVIEGEVLLIGLMTTKIREYATGNIVSIANRRIEEVALVSEKLYIPLPFPYNLDVDISESIINEVIAQAKQNRNIIECENLGISELADFEINHLLEVSCKPSNKNSSRRFVLELFVLEMEKRKIDIPYNKISIVRPK